jgi:AraC-like DNA-binding protein
VEERLEALQEAWTGFIVEFPTYPKVTAHGREENQRILFLCSVQEENPSELCLALFNTQILLHRLQYGEMAETLPRAQVVLLYAGETLATLGGVLAYYQERVDAPIVLARKTNVRRAAGQVMAMLTGAGRLAEEATAGEWRGGVFPEKPGLGKLGRAPDTLSDEATLWQGAMPEISLANAAGTVTNAATELQDYRAEYACRYVLAHFAENINRDKMAEMVNLSPGYFSNLFRAEVGMSFSDYLIQVRIENAKRLLRRFDLSVEAISKQCGFNSLAHFSRTFKDRCGLSPLKYRKSPNSVA